MLFAGSGQEALTLGRLLLLLLIAVQTALFGLTMQVLPSEEQMLLGTAALLLMSVLLVLGGIFPSFKMPARIIPSYAPVAASRAAGLHFLYHSLRPGTLYGLFFLMVFMGISASYGALHLSFLISGILLLPGVNACELGVKQLMEKGFFRTRPSVTSPLAITAILLMLSFSGFFALSFYAGFTGAFFLLYDEARLALMLAFTAFSGFFYAQSYHYVSPGRPAFDTPYSAGGVEQKSAGLYGLAARAYRRRPASRITFFIILIGNPALALYIYFIDMEAWAQMLGVLLILPITLFSYVHHNVWGMHRELWLAAACAPSGRRALVKLYAGSLLPSLLLHAATGFGLLYMLQLLELRHLLIYVLVLPQALITGYWCSFRHPRPTGRTFTSLQNNSSFWGNALLVVTSGITAVLIFYAGLWPSLAYASVFSAGMMLYIRRLLRPSPGGRSTERLFLRLFSN